MEKKTVFTIEEQYFKQKPRPKNSKRPKTKQNK